MLAAALLVLTIWSPRCARADDAPPAAVAPADPGSLVRDAIRMYQAGDPDSARQALLTVLSSGPDLPAAVRRQALAWLGEILLGAQGPAAARSAFEALLGEEPNYTLDPFEHSPEACAAFEQVRAPWLTRQVAPPPTDAPPPPADPPPRERWPVGLLVPGGARYLATGRPVAGLVSGGLQVAGTAVSAVTAVQMIQMQGDPLDTDTAAAARYRRLGVVNVLSGAVAWGAYLTPVLVETVRWGRSTTTVSVGPGAVELRGSF